MSRQAAERGLTMMMPMTKQDIGRVKNGRMTKATIPVPPPGDLKPGDEVTFYEVVFDARQTPIMVPGGVTVTVRLTQVQGSVAAHGGATLFKVEWA
jgi:hypothetical protein